MSQPRYPMGSLITRLEFGEVPDNLTPKEREMALFIRQLLRQQQEMERERAALGEHLAALEKTSTLFATVIEVRRQERRVIVAAGDQIGCYDLGAYMGAVEPGDSARLSKDGDFIAVDRAPLIGTVRTVDRRLGRRLVTSDGHVILHDRSGTADLGHEVLLDSSDSCIMVDFGKPPSKLAFTEETGVTWDDISGHEQAKALLREAVEGPVVHADEYREFGIAVP